MQTDSLIETIFVDGIHVGQRHRAVDEARVDALVASIQQLGRLMTPITVYFDDVEIGGRIFHETAVLVAGAHRLAAIKRLSWEQVEVLVLEGDAIDRELWEIDENLMRSELTPAQVAGHLQRRKELWSEKTGQTSPSLGGRGVDGFASDVGGATGMAKRTVNQALSRAEALGSDLADIAGTSLDKGVELDALAKLGTDERRGLIDRARAGEQVTARKPVSPPESLLNDNEVSNKYRQRLMSAWNAAPAEDRQWFREIIDTPVMDRKFSN